MAEQEVAQHSKNIIGLVTSKEHALGHRLREIAIEIATIVFAVSMSIWLHGLSEHHHQQEEVRSFLIGLRGDLQDDIANVAELKDAYHRFDANFVYLSSLDPGAAPDPQKFEQAYQLMDSNAFLIPNRSRFDGFMTSGKLSNIEDEALLSHVLALYQSLLPQIKMSENGWGSMQQRLRDYREDALTTDDLQDHYHLVTASRGKRLIKHMKTFPQLYQRYDAYSDMCKQIIKEIDAAYPNVVGAKAH